MSPPGDTPSLRAFCASAALGLKCAGQDETCSWRFSNQSHNALLASFRLPHASSGPWAAFLAQHGTFLVHFLCSSASRLAGPSQLPLYPPGVMTLRPRATRIRKAIRLQGYRRQPYLTLPSSSLNRRSASLRFLCVFARNVFGFNSQPIDGPRDSVLD